MGTIGPQLDGNLVALFTPFFVTGVISLIWPQKYNWDDLRRDTELGMIESDEAATLDAEGAESKEALDKVYNISCANAVGMTAIMIFLWPALALPANTFTKSYFGWWVAIAFIWAHFAFIVTVLLPIYEFIFPAEGYDKWGNKITQPQRTTSAAAQAHPEVKDISEFVRAASSAADSNKITEDKETGVKAEFETRKEQELLALPVSMLPSAVGFHVPTQYGFA